MYTAHRLDIAGLTEERAYYATNARWSVPPWKNRGCIKLVGAAIPPFPLLFRHSRRHSVPLPFRHSRHHSAIPAAIPSFPPPFRPAAIPSFPPPFRHSRRHSVPLPFRHSRRPSVIPAKAGTHEVARRSAIQRCEGASRRGRRPNWYSIIGAPP